MKSFYGEIGLSVLCGLVGRTRQAYYEVNWRTEKRQFENSVIVDLVKRERKIAERAGGKKLFLILRAELELHEICIGRDKFYPFYGITIC